MTITSFLLALHFVLTIAIICLIMLQKHDSDGALGSGGSAGGMFSVKGQANILTKTTAFLMTVFIINCLVMAKLYKRTKISESLIDAAQKESQYKINPAENLPLKPDNEHHSIAPTQKTLDEPIETQKNSEKSQNTSNKVPKNKETK